MLWEQGDVYVCPNPDCGLEVFVRRASRHAAVGKQTAICLCGTPLQKRLAEA